MDFMLPTDDNHTYNYKPKVRMERNVCVQFTAEFEEEKTWRQCFGTYDFCLHLIKDIVSHLTKDNALATFD